MKEFLRPAEIAPLLGVSRQRVYQLIAEGILPAVTIGGAIRIPARAWEEWLTQQGNKALTAAQSKENSSRDGIP